MTKRRIIKRVKDENEDSFASPIAVMINSDDDTESPLVTDTRLMTPSTTRDDSLLYTSSGGSGGEGRGPNDSGNNNQTTRGGHQPEGHVQTLQIGHYAVPSALRYSNNNRTANMARSSTTPRGIRSAKDLLLSNRDREVRIAKMSNHHNHGNNHESMPLASPSSILSPSSLMMKESSQSSDRVAAAGAIKREGKRGDESLTETSSPNPTHSRSTNTSAAAIIFAN